MIPFAIFSFEILYCLGHSFLPFLPVVISASVKLLAGVVDLDDGVAGLDDGVAGLDGGLGDLGGGDACLVELLE